MRIYVGNLSYSVTSEDLREVFSQYGEVASAEVVQDKFSGQSKGFGNRRLMWALPANPIGGAPPSAIDQACALVSR